jgi:hypothetical protein
MTISTLASVRIIDSLALGEGELVDVGELDSLGTSLGSAVGEIDGLSLLGIRSSSGSEVAPQFG